MKTHSIEKLSTHEGILVPKEKRVLDLHVTQVLADISANRKGD